MTWNELINNLMVNLAIKDLNEDVTIKIDDDYYTVNYMKQRNKDEVLGSGAWYLTTDRYFDQGDGVLV